MFDYQLLFEKEARTHSLNSHIDGTRLSGENQAYRIEHPRGKPRVMYLFMLVLGRKPHISPTVKAQFSVLLSVSASR